MLLFNALFGVNPCIWDGKFGLKKLETPPVIWCKAKFDMLNRLGVTDALIACCTSLHCMAGNVAAVQSTTVLHISMIRQYILFELVMFIIGHGHSFLRNSLGFF